MLAIDVRAGRRGSGAKGLMLGALLLSACSSDSGDSAEKQLNFSDCPADLPGQTQGRTCATAKVPLRWDNPHGKAIELLVARYRGESAGSGQLWLLDGGPGGTGAGYMDPEVLALYTSLGLDVYIPQHRGTGHSTPLHCDDAGDLSACGAALVDTWGDGLQGFHSVEAGQDVGFLVQHAGVESERRFVFGLSYGSYWAQRYLQAFPLQADGIILEGVFPLGERLWECDPLADAAARSLFEACRADSTCASAFGDEDPEDVALRVVVAAGDPAKRCLGEGGLATAELEEALGGLLVGDLGMVVPGVIRRLDRCNTADQEQLMALAETLRQALAIEPDEHTENYALGLNVLRTDLMATLKRLPLDELLAARAPLIFWSGAALLEDLDAVVDAWPVNYPPADNRLPKEHSPVLLLNGGLDVQSPSPWARELTTRLGGQLVEFPFAGHGVDISLAKPFTAADPSCSLSLLGAFVEHPAAPVDGTCAATAYTPDVAGNSEIGQALATALFGADTPLLGDTAVPRAKSAHPPHPALSLAAIITALRSRIHEAHGARRPR